MKFKVGEVEMSKYDMTVKFFESNAVAVKTDEKTDAGASASTSDDVFEGQIKLYMEKNKVDYKTALIAVSPNEGAPMTEKAAE